LKRFDRAVRLFGEDGSVVQPEEFFGIFDTFLSSFAEARNDNESFRKRQEEDEKRAKQEAEVKTFNQPNLSGAVIFQFDFQMKKRTIERKNKEGLLNSVATKLGLKSESKPTENSKGEFDDLISALRTGDVFGEDMAKFKRSRKTRAGPTTNGNHANTSPPRNRNSLSREESRERPTVVARR
jgi:dishevelled associated activator of morphogenesis